MSESSSMFPVGHHYPHVFATLIVRIVIVIAAAVMGIFY